MFIDIHTHQLNMASNSVFNAIVLKDVVPIDNWFSLGIHPWYINDVEEQLLVLKNEIEKTNINFLFIGECGLDKVNGADYAKQEEVFRSQIELSEKYKKPLIIHCVKAYNELIKLKKELKPKQIWILHGFNRNLNIAKSLLEEGVWLSFGMTFLQTPNGKEVLLNTPLNKIFFETDDNKEYSISKVYTLASEILSINIELLRKTIKENLWQIIG